MSGFVLPSLSLLLDDDVGHSVHLCELLAVQRRHQLPGSRLCGDEVLRQRHRGESTHVAARGRAMVRACKNEILKKMQKGWKKTSCTHPTTTSWPFCRPRPSTLNTTPFSMRGSGLVKVILAAISFPTTASPTGCWKVDQGESADRAIRRRGCDRGQAREPTAILRSGVRSLKVVWLASTCCVSVTLPDRVSISAAWSTSWSWYCW